MKFPRILVIAVGLVVLYFAVGAYVLRFRLEPLVLPHTSASSATSGLVVARIERPSGAILVRRYGTGRVGCVLFFPGQHGNLPTYESELFPAFTANGVAVLAIAYPGQDGAPGTASLDQTLALATRAVAAARATCPNHRVVLYGRSLGTMVSAYSTRGQQLVGLILEGAAPSLSAAVRSRLRTRIYLAPLAVLPLSALLSHDYSLAEALPTTRRFPVVAFQGTADRETPSSALESSAARRPLRIIAVPGGTHSTTYRLARKQIVQVALSMLRQQPR